MIAEILRTLFTIMMILALLITIVEYYLSYTWYMEYREDRLLQGDKWMLFGAIFLAFCATMLGLVLLWVIAESMGW